jgi:O-antigen/teichoic acid export membrane protein
MALYGPGFASRGTVLRITVITAGLLAIQTPVGNIIVATGRMWLGTLMNLGWASVLLISTRLFLRCGWGADGAAGAYLIAYLVHTIWTFWFAGSVLGGWGQARLSDAIEIPVPEAAIDEPSF